MSDVSGGVGSLAAGSIGVVGVPVAHGRHGASRRGHPDRRCAAPRQRCDRPGGGGARLRDRTHHLEDPFQCGRWLSADALAARGLVRLRARGGRRGDGGSQR